MNNISPCVGICKLDKATGWCLGCGRTGDEIARWISHSDSERELIWSAIPERLKQLGPTGLARHEPGYSALRNNHSDQT